MVDLPIEHDDDQEEIEIDDPELLAALEEAEQQIDRGEFGRSIDEILAEFRREQR
jgi:hypothetical protein